MASSKSRQRDLARAKYHRQMARKAASERRRRQVWASVAAFLAVLLLGAGGAWVLGFFDKDTQPVASDFCYWTSKPADSGGESKDVGLPPSKSADIPQDGTRNMNVTFAAGLVEIQLDLRRAPCTAASFTYLAGKNFFDNTKCHRLLDSGVYVLQCGDPAGTGRGGPTYSFGDENLPDKPVPTASPGPSDPPTAENVIYPRGTVAMANGGPNTNGSQFFIVYRDSSFPPNYTRFGNVSKGLDVIEKIAAGGTVDNGQGEKSKPTSDVFIQSLTVTEVQANPATQPSAPPPSAPPSGGPSATPATTASASAAPKS